MFTSGMCPFFFFFLLMFYVPDHILDSHPIISFVTTNMAENIKSCIIIIIVLVIIALLFEITFLKTPSCGCQLKDIIRFPFKYA